MDEDYFYFKELEKIIEHYFVKALIHLKLPIINLNIGIHGSGGRKSKFFGEFNPDKEYININLTKEYDPFLHYSKEE